MKKNLLFFALVFSALFVKGQLAFTPTWYYNATTNAGELVMTTNGANSVAYNPVTGKLYVTNRGDEIYIINPDDYSGTIPSIPKAGLSKLNRGGNSEQYRFNKVRVDADGVIYATALQTNGTAVIYRWASESAAPVMKSFTVNMGVAGVRVGESLAVYGTGNSTLIYVASNRGTSPANGQFLYVFKVIDGVVELAGIVDMSIGFATVLQSSFYDIAGSSISAETEDMLWVSVGELGVSPRRIKINLAGLDNTGATATPLISSQTISTIGGNFLGVEFVNQDSEGFALSYSSRSNTAGGGGLGLTFHVYKTGAVGLPTVTLTKSAEASLAKSTAYVSTVGISDLVVRTHADNSKTVYFLSTNNGLGAFKANGTLPVSLTSFNAALLNNQSNLTWATSSESNNKGFEIHRSTDGENFQSVAFVASKADGGNSTTTLNYTYSDKTAKAGLNYYKLVQVDLDGKTEVFKDVKAVNLGVTNNSIVVYPNPATDQVTIDLAEYKGVKIEIFDTNGKKLLTEKAKSSQQTISISKLAPAVYVLRVIKDGQIVQSLKVVKN